MKQTAEIFRTGEVVINANDERQWGVVHSLDAENKGDHINIKGVFVSWGDSPDEPGATPVEPLQSFSFDMLIKADYWQSAIYWAVVARKNQKFAEKQYLDLRLKYPDLVLAEKARTVANSAAKEAETVARDSALNFIMQAGDKDSLKAFGLIIEWERYEWQFNPVKAVAFCARLSRRFPGLLIADGYGVKIDKDLFNNMLAGMSDEERLKLEAVKVHAPRVKLPANLSYADYRIG